MEEVFELDGNLAMANDIVYESELKNSFWADVYYYMEKHNCSSEKAINTMEKYYEVIGEMRVKFKPKNLRSGIWIALNNKLDKAYLIEHGDQSFAFYTRRIHARSIDGEELKISKEDLNDISIVAPPLEKQFHVGDIVKLSEDIPTYAIRNGRFSFSKEYIIHRVGKKGSINLIDECGRKSIFISPRHFLYVNKINL